MKKYTFKKTATQTAKINNAVKVDNKNVIDYSYIVETLEKIDLAKYENLHFSNRALIEKFTEIMSDHKIISDYINGNLFAYFRIDNFYVLIESTVNHFSVYNDDGKQIYKYHYANNARIGINHYNTNIFYETFNHAAFVQLTSNYTEINYHENADNIKYA